MKMLLQLDDIFIYLFWIAVIITSIIKAQHVPVNIPDTRKRLTLEPALPLSLSSTNNGAKENAKEVQKPWVIPRTIVFINKKTLENLIYPCSSR